MQAKPLRKNLGEVRQAIIEELHETILEESDLIKKVYEKHKQKSSAKKFDRMIDFVMDKDGYKVDPELSEAGVFGTVPPPAGPTIERYGSGNPWPWDRF